MYPLLDDHEWPDQRDAARGMLDRLVEAAVGDGTFAGDDAVTDISLAAIRFSRPLAVDPK